MGYVIHTNSVFCSQKGCVSEREARLWREQQWVSSRAHTGHYRLQAHAWALSSTPESARWNLGRA